MSPRLSWLREFGWVRHIIKSSTVSAETKYSHNSLITIDY